MSFSLAVSNFDGLEFVRTTWWRKLLRALLGGGLSVGIWFAFKAIPLSFNQDVQFHFFKRYLPYFLIPLFMYGPFLVIC